MSLPERLWPTVAPTSSCVILDPDPVAVRHARGLVQACCAAAGASADTTDTVVLLTSEVVTNAFLHGRSRATLSVTTGWGLIRVEVSDDNSRHPSLVPADKGALDGRGLTMVDMLATTWGVRDYGLGKIVWFSVSIT